MNFLKQSTAYTFRLGPFVDEDDGKTAENSLTIAYTSVLLSKAGGALAQKNETTNLTGTGANAHYTCVMDATDTNTLGGLRVYCHVSGALPVWKDFVVVPAVQYNSLIAGTDYLEVDAVAISGDTAAADNLETACDNYSATRGLAGTALPAAAADAAGGLPISDAGGLDLDGMNTNISDILTDTGEIGAAGAGLSAIPWNTTAVTPDSRTVTTGAETGTFPTDLGSADWSYWITSDGAGVYDVKYQWGVMPASGSIPVNYIPVGIKVRLTLAGFATEDPTFALWNYKNTVFDDIKTVVATSPGGYYSDFYIPLKEPYVILDSSSNATADAVRLRIYGTAEAAGRKVYIDYVLLDCYDPTKGSIIPFPFLSQNTDITDPADHSNIAKEATLGTPTGADLASDINSIMGDVAEIGVAGAGLSAIPDMALNSTVAKEATLGTPAGADLATDIAAIPGLVDTELSGTHGAGSWSGGTTVPTSYAPTAGARTVGDDDGGDFTDLAAHDDTSMSSGEVAVTGLDVLITRGTSDIALVPARIHITGYYNGGGSHHIDVLLYNYSTSAWEEAGIMRSRSAPFNYVFPLEEDNQEPATGEMKVRFLHNTATYVASHVLHLDYISWECFASADDTSEDLAAIRAKTDRIKFADNDDLIATLDGEMRDETWTKVAVSSTVYKIVISGVGYYTVDEVAQTRTFTADTTV